MILIDYRSNEDKSGTQMKAKDRDGKEEKRPQAAKGESEKTESETSLSTNLTFCTLFTAVSSRHGNQMIDGCQRRDAVEEAVVAWWWRKTSKN
jgi:hypothetical protein